MLHQPYAVVVSQSSCPLSFLDQGQHEHRVAAAEGSQFDPARVQEGPAQDTFADLMDLVGRQRLQAEACQQPVPCLSGQSGRQLVDGPRQQKQADPSGGGQLGQEVGAGLVQQMRVVHHHQGPGRGIQRLPVKVQLLQQGAHHAKRRIRIGVRQRRKQRCKGTVGNLRQRGRGMDPENREPALQLRQQGIGERGLAHSPFTHDECPPAARPQQFPGQRREFPLPPDQPTRGGTLNHPVLRPPGPSVHAARPGPKHAASRRACRGASPRSGATGSGLR